MPVQGNPDEFFLTDEIAGQTPDNNLELVMFRNLNPAKITETIETLHNWTDERFPGSGLSKMCEELLATLL